MNSATRPKGWLVGAWTVTSVSFAITAPIMFLAGIFTSDNSSGATSVLSYALIASPIALFVLPAIAQASYSRAKFGLSKACSILSIGLCAVTLGYLGFLISQ